MASRARRTRFAASFVVVVGGASCSHGGPGGDTPTTGSGSAQPAHATWQVHQGNDGSCYATPYVDCSAAPKGATCNPPASTRTSCRDPMPANGYTIISYDGTTCYLDDGKTVIDCPGHEPPPPPPADAAEVGSTTGSGPGSAHVHIPRRWSIIAGDKTCYAQQTNGIECPPTATCNPPAPTKVACAMYSPGSTVDEIQPGLCQTVHVEGGGNCPPGVHCNPPPPRTITVECP